jgi:hypothetical protein
MMSPLEAAGMNLLVRDQEQWRIGGLRVGDGRRSARLNRGTELIADPFGPRLAAVGRLAGLLRYDRAENPSCPTSDAR